MFLASPGHQRVPGGQAPGGRVHPFWSYARRTRCSTSSSTSATLLSAILWVACPGPWDGCRRPDAGGSVDRRPRATRARAAAPAARRELAGADERRVAAAALDAHVVTKPEDGRGESVIDRAEGRLGAAVLAVDVLLDAGPHPARGPRGGVGDGPLAVLRDAVL